MIIQNFQNICQQEGLPLIYVLFYGQRHLEAADMNWREIFLKEEFKKRNIPFFDSKRPLIKYAATHGSDFGIFYATNDTHHNDLGNKLIAEAFVEYLTKNGYYPVQRQA